MMRRVIEALFREDLRSFVLGDLYNYGIRPKAFQGWTNCASNFDLRESVVSAVVGTTFYLL
jgi:hypothetical protein